MTERLRGRDVGLSLRQTAVVDARPQLDDFVHALRDDRRYASAYDRLLSSLDLAARSRPGGRVLVTSARPGEGKSTVVVNLAVAMGLAGRRVLVVDADLRCPALHRLLDVGNHRGLADVLSGQCAAADVVQSIDLPTTASPARSLSVITSGPVSADSVHLLGSPRMAAALGDVSQPFDFVLLDSPPILPVNDPIVLSTVSDMVVFVIQAGETAGPEVRRARQRLERVSDRIVGSVLTRFDGAWEDDGQYAYPYGPDAGTD
jgi:capsular exopolysaccharide synthesis family protein